MPEKEDAQPAEVSKPQLESAGSDGVKATSSEPGTKVDPAPGNVQSVVVKTDASAPSEPKRTDAKSAPPVDEEDGDKLEKTPEKPASTAAAVDESTSKPAPGAGEGSSAAAMDTTSDEKAQKPTAEKKVANKSNVENGAAASSAKDKASTATEKSASSEPKPTKVRKDGADTAKAAAQRRHGDARTLSRRSRNAVVVRPAGYYTPFMLYIAENHGDILKKAEVTGQTSQVDEGMAHINSWKELDEQNIEKFRASARSDEIRRETQRHYAVSWRVTHARRESAELRSRKEERGCRRCRGATASRRRGKGRQNDEKAKEERFGGATKCSRCIHVLFQRTAPASEAEGQGCVLW